MLLIDIGNTRIKWARFEDGRLGAMAALPHEGLKGEELSTAMLAGSRPAARVFASNVAGANVAALVSECVSRVWGVEVEFVQSSAAAGGVRNGYRDPAKLGVDRWMATIGAYSLAKGAACAVSVGTAMTIDAVDESGRHRGGVIVPGADLMVASLFRNTSEIARRAEHGVSTRALFADNTRGAVEQGAVHALASLVDRAVDVFRLETGETPAVFVCGGGAERIVHGLRSEHRLTPDLVLRGLAVVAREAG